MTSPSVGPAGNRRVGFIGLGNMGRPMAGLLQQAGYALTVYDIRKEAVEQFVAETGGEAAASPADVARSAPVVITMLPDGTVVRDVVLGGGRQPEGTAVVDGLAEGGVVVDMSSSHPEQTQRLAAELAERGIRLIDAPVSGGVRRARTGTLGIMIGGDVDAVPGLRDLLQVMGENLIVLGDVGSGHAAKTLNNLLSATGLVAAAEVFLVGRKWGLDLNALLEAINSSTGYNNSTHHKLAQFVFNRCFRSGAELHVLVKDLSIAVDLAQKTQTPLPIGTLVRELWASAEHLIGAHADHTEVVKLFERLAGAELDTRDSAGA